MNRAIFEAGLRAVHSQVPYARDPRDEELAFLYQALPADLLETVTDRHWLWACQQRLLDPSPPKDDSILQQILRYLYRLKDDHPEISWGLKPDLEERMQASGFISPTPPQPEGYLQPPDPQLLLPSLTVNPMLALAHETLEQRQERIARILATTLPNPPAAEDECHP